MLDQFLISQACMPSPSSCGGAIQASWIYFQNINLDTGSASCCGGSREVLFAR